MKVSQASFITASEVFDRMRLLQSDFDDVVKRAIIDRVVTGQSVICSDGQTIRNVRYEEYQKKVELCNLLKINKTTQEK